MHDAKTLSTPKTSELQLSRLGSTLVVDTKLYKLVIRVDNN